MNITVTEEDLGQKAFLLATADMFRESPRLGAEYDEPEGERYVQISSTLAIDLAERFERIAEGL